jgi:hypothetical protein
LQPVIFRIVNFIVKLPSAGRTQKKPADVIFHANSFLLINKLEKLP